VFVTCRTQPNGENWKESLLGLTPDHSLSKPFSIKLLINELYLPFLKVRKKENQRHVAVVAAVVVVVMAEVVFTYEP